MDRRRTRTGAGVRHRGKGPSAVLAVGLTVTEAMTRTPRIGETVFYASAMDDEVGALAGRFFDRVEYVGRLQKVGRFLDAAQTRVIP